MIITMMSVSLDGFFEGPDHDLSWHEVDDELLDFFNADLAKVDAFVEGRRTYELMEEVWPTGDENPEFTQSMRDFAPIWRNTPKIVYSRTLQQCGPNAEIRREVIADEVRALPGDSMVGGAELTETFFELDLIDEVRLYVHPVAIGRGKPFFRRPIALALKNTRAFGNGVVQLTYGRRFL